MLPCVVIKTCTCHAPVLKEEGNKIWPEFLHTNRLLEILCMSCLKIACFHFSSQLKSRNPLNEPFSAIVYLKSVNLNKFKISADYRRLRINSVEWPNRHV